MSYVFLNVRKQERVKIQHTIPPVCVHVLPIIIMYVNYIYTYERVF